MGRNSASPFAVELERADSQDRRHVAHSTRLPELLHLGAAISSVDVKSQTRSAQIVDDALCAGSAKAFTQLRNSWQRSRSVERIYDFIDARSVTGTRRE